MSSDGRLIVAKLGSSTLVDKSGEPDREFIEDLCRQVASLVGEGDRVIIVSSGAAAAGFRRLGLDARPTDLSQLQACCAAGQASLTELYAEALEEHGIPCGQVLLTRDDVMSRAGYLNVRNTFDALLELGAVPVVNENDTVSPTEFAFGDNDMLGAIVSVLCAADLYVILSDVDGLHERNPQTDPDAPVVRRVTKVDGEIRSMAGSAGSLIGTGGMAAKVRAGRAMIAAGIPMVVCEGRAEDALVRAARGEQIGTLFEGEKEGAHEAPRKFWIGLANVPMGTLVVDPGAERALVEGGASLLPVGITEVRGSFAEGDVVSVVNANGDLLGRGLVRYSSDDLRKVHGLRLEVIERFMPEKSGQPAIHRDELLVF